MSYVRLRCPHIQRNGQRCPTVFGVTDGQRLYQLGTMIERPVTLHCTRPGCPGRRTWHPERSARPGEHRASR